MGNVGEFHIFDIGSIGIFWGLNKKRILKIKSYLKTGFYGLTCVCMRMSV